MHLHWGCTQIYWPYLIPLDFLYGIREEMFKYTFLLIAVLNYRLYLIIIRSLHDVNTLQIEELCLINGTFNNNYVCMINDLKHILLP